MTRFKCYTTYNQFSKGVLVYFAIKQSEYPYLFLSVQNSTKITENQSMFNELNYGSYVKGSGNTRALLTIQQ